LKEWEVRYHKGDLPLLRMLKFHVPLILLSGEVGCGKTELAQTIASPLSPLVGGKRIKVMETPSNIRGGGKVGELSQRLTAAFEQARYDLKPRELGILIIDEADDLATQRSQVQAHHEDRAGVNVLIKEIDKLKEDNIPLAVILITNRIDALDSAVLRRATTQLTLGRPNRDSCRELLKMLLKDIPHSEVELEKIVTELVSNKGKFTFSDITNRIAFNGLIEAYLRDRPLAPDIILEVIYATNPTPLLA